jgi:hypothetical protein
MLAHKQTLALSRNNDDAKTADDRTIAAHDTGMRTPFDIPNGAVLLSSQQTPSQTASPANKLPRASNRREMKFVADVEHCSHKLSLFDGMSQLTSRNTVRLISRLARSALYLTHFSKRPVK